MRHMADGRHRVIVAVTGDYDRKGPYGLCELEHPLHILRADLGLRREDIVGVFQKARLGISVSDALASRHGVTADETAFQAGFPYGPVNIRFGAAHIGKEHPGLYKRLQEPQVLGVVLYGRAEEDDITPGKAFSDGGNVFVDDAVVNGFLNGFLMRRECKDAGLRHVFADGPGDGAADEADPHKSECISVCRCYCFFHMNCPF